MNEDFTGVINDGADNSQMTNNRRNVGNRWLFDLPEGARPGEQGKFYSFDTNSSRTEPIK
jgi:hypothetical protein